MDPSLGLSPYGNACSGGGFYNQSMHVPKFGTLIPNRIFVGGIAGDTTENELKHFFSAFGNVRDCKIILDRGGLSKSYGFVTFESQDDAEKLLKRSSDTLIMRDRKLNIGPAIRKQGVQNGRLYGGGESVSASLNTCSGNGNGGSGGYMTGGVGAGALIYPNAVSYAAAALGNGVTLMCTSDGYLIPTQPAQAMYPSVIYQSPQGSYYQSPIAASATPTVGGQWAAASSPAQWRWPSISTPAGTSLVASPCGQYIYQIPNSTAAAGGGTAAGGAPVMSSDVLFAQAAAAAASSTYHQSAAAGSGDMMGDS